MYPLINFSKTKMVVEVKNIEDLFKTYKEQEIAKSILDFIADSTVIKSVVDIYQGVFKSMEKKGYKLAPFFDDQVIDNISNLLYKEGFVDRSDNKKKITIMTEKGRDFYQTLKNKIKHISEVN